MSKALQRYREYRSMGYGESRAKAAAAIELARESNESIDAITKRIENELRLAANTPTRSGGVL